MLCQPRPCRPAMTAPDRHNGRGRRRSTPVVSWGGWGCGGSLRRCTTRSRCRGHTSSSSFRAFQASSRCFLRASNSSSSCEWRAISLSRWRRVCVSGLLISPGPSRMYCCGGAGAGAGGGRGGGGVDNGLPACLRGLVRTPYAAVYRPKRGGGGYDAWLCCSLQRAAPMGLSPLTAALPLNPLPQQAAAPIGLSPPCALPPPAWPTPPPCDIPSGCCFFTGPWTVTHSPLRMLRRVAAFCRPLRPVLLLVSFPRSRSPVPFPFPFPSGGCANGAPRLSLFRCSVSGLHGGGPNRWWWWWIPYSIPLYTPCNPLYTCCILPVHTSCAPAAIQYPNVPRFARCNGTNQIVFPRRS